MQSQTHIFLLLHDPSVVRTWTSDYVWYLGSLGFAGNQVRGVAGRRTQMGVLWAVGIPRPVEQPNCRHQGSQPRESKGKKADRANRTVRLGAVAGGVRVTLGGGDPTAS